MQSQSQSSEKLLQPSICLNMIVKNESHIIHKTLAMLCSKIRFDYWVICDTGSTDTTREIIQDFFEKAGIVGELHCDEWVNFAHNRTKALEYAYGKTDLLLVFDADDDICGTIAMPSEVTHDEYHLKFGAPNLGTTYTRTLLINNHKRFQYFSVVHEYISCLEPSPNEQLRICILDGDYYVVSGRSGARNQDPDKYLKDARLLETAHAEALAQGDHLHKRYAFYCANSYRDCGRHQEAIRWYKTTLEQDNWAQEKYVSCLYMYECYEALGQKEHGFFYLVKAFAYDLERVECLYPLVVHYCCEGGGTYTQIAYNYYRIVQSHYEKTQLQPHGGSKLFLQSDKANFFLPYYMIIVADRVGDRKCGVCMYEIIFRKKHLIFSVWHLRNLFFNLRFFIKQVDSVHELSNSSTTLSQFAELANEYLQFIRENGVSLQSFEEITKDFDYTEYGIHLLNPYHPMLIGQPIISTNFSLSECKRSCNILFYTGYSSVPWNYSSMKRGALGGSEKAVAYLSNELMKNGYTVYVSGGVQPEELDSHNDSETNCTIKYVGLSDLPELLRTMAFHTIICSRYISFLEIYGNTSSFYQFYIWAHDTHLLPYGCNLSDTVIIDKWSDYIDGCVCQTQWHADEYARQYPIMKDKIHIINNGIDQLFPLLRPQKIQNRFIYTSRTERGLKRILELWPEIVAALPDATLVISTYVAFPCNDDERDIQSRIAELNETYKTYTYTTSTVNYQISEEARIRHLGQLNTEQLYAEMSKAEYWLYPTDWPETSCITAMEMLMSEVICLYYPVAGLTDTMSGCGIQIAPGTEIETLCKIASDEKEKETMRQQGRAYAESCSWANRAQQWETIIIDSNKSVLPILSDLPHFKTWIINLKRRSDRKLEIESKLKTQKITSYAFMNAVDGNQLIHTDHIMRMFKDNDFQYRKGVIGCAMSHMSLWKQLIRDPECELYVIMEDDAEFVDNFELKLHEAISLFMNDSSSNAELCFISGFSIKTPCRNVNQLKIIKKNNHKVDGLGGYLIKKSGAIRFMQYYNEHSMKRAVDASIVHDFNDHLCELNEYLIKSPFFGTDTDIQKSFDMFQFAPCDECNVRDEYNDQTNDNHRHDGDLVIGFHTNQMCERGTEVALFDYAFYNQTLYGNKSIVFYNKNNPNNNPNVIVRFESHFKCYAYNDFAEIDNILISEGADYFYNIGQGMDMQLVSACPNCLHEVFQMKPHGERYATVSRHLSLSFNRPDIPSVPHIVHFRSDNNNDCSDMREILGIPGDASVFGRYGGFGQFDIPYVHEAIREFVQMNGNAYFIFANTRTFCEAHAQIIHLDTIYDEAAKIKFINTCDAMIHARSDGETFGLSIAEFSIKNKPVITTHSSLPNSDAHIDMLGERAIIYRNKTELLTIFENIKQIAASRNDWNAYADYTPESVMRQFMEVFIKPAPTSTITPPLKTITVAFCDWWEIEYGGGTFNAHDNFFVNLLKRYNNLVAEIKTVSPSQNPDVLFYSVFGSSVGSYRARRKVFYSGEPFAPRLDADFNITFDESNAINTRLPLWVCYFDETLLNSNSDRVVSKREKFCSYIATQPGFENNRERFVEMLSSKYKQVDCGGKHLNNIGGAILPGTNASGKIEHNKQYKFAIAFENKQHPGYVTEKICDVYKSGCIPIYWGTPDVVKDFNPSTFINVNDFPDFDALIDHIGRVDCDDELYACYFKEPILSDAWMQIFTDPNHTFFKQLVSDILKM